MSNTEKKIYRVLKPIAWGGRREIGETLALSDEEAANLGGEYVAPTDESVITPAKRSNQRRLSNPRGVKKPKNKPT